MSYLNDWFWMPILLFMWLPILYFGKIRSVPEYFEKRFGLPARIAATFLILTYLIGYVGINLFTLGQVLETLLGIPIMVGASITAFVVMLYMFSGGQTSVIMTDLAQGVILLIAGLGLFLTGVFHFGGFSEFWALLPRDHKFIFSEFSEPANEHATDRLTRAYDASDPSNWGAEGCPGTVRVNPGRAVWGRRPAGGRELWQLGPEFTGTASSERRHLCFRHSGSFPSVEAGS